MHKKKLDISLFHSLNVFKCCRVKRASLNQSATPKPIPGGGKPRPPMKPKPALPKCKALYDYTAQDLDELTFKEGDVIEVLKEGKYFYVIYLHICYVLSVYKSAGIHL